MDSDDAFDLLDQHWSSGDGIALPPLLETLDVGETPSIIELCAADLEWRWRTYAEGGGSPVHGLPRRPFAKDYRELVGQLWSMEIHQRNLLEAEWCARSVWGDQPDVFTFAEPFAQWSGWTDELSAQLNRLRPMTAAVDGPGFKQPQALAITHDFVIGRQGADDLPALSWDEMNNRLVVAAPTYRRISREQLRVRRTRIAEIELSNISRSVDGSWGQHYLAAGASMRLPLPCKIGIGSVKLHLA